MKFEIKQIGIIHSPYKTKEECPIQGNVKPEGRGQIEVFPEYEEALETIETFSHIICFLYSIKQVKLNYAGQLFWMIHRMGFSRLYIPAGQIVLVSP